MNWFSKIFSTKESDKKEETVKEKGYPENKQDGVVLEGLGSSKKLFKMFIKNKEIDYLNGGKDIPEKNILTKL